MLSRLFTTRNRLSVAVATVALATVGLTALTTGAFFTDTKTVTGNSFTTGSVVLSTTPTTAAVTMSAMAPGDVKVGTVTVQNTGSLAMRYAMLSTADNTDGKALNAALQMTVKTGVTTCDATNFAATGTVQYGPATFGAIAGTKVLGDAAQGAQAGDRILAAGATEVLCVQVTLPPATSNAFQNATTTAAFKFDAEQVIHNP